MVLIPSEQNPADKATRKEKLKKITPDFVIRDSLARISEWLKIVMCVA